MKKAKISKKKEKKGTNVLMEGYPGHQSIVCVCVCAHTNT